MLIFEYRCFDCNSTFELLTKGDNKEDIIYPECHSSNSKKLFSAFSTSVNISSYSGDSCASGNCNIDTLAFGGCINGMCSVN